MLAPTKNKTTAAWLAFLLGQTGLHRIYLFGLKDLWAWAHPLAAVIGWYGVYRVRNLGQDDHLAWLLVPVLGFLLAITAITAICYGLSSMEKWNTAHNPQQLDAPAGQTNWLVMGAVVFSLLMGATALMSSIAFSFQRYFEYQIEEDSKMSQ
jgi:TM2 domain-containing membrane protein YozV